jgi:hypothetical protein
MKIPFVLIIAFALLALTAQAQITVNPDGVNVNSQGATTVFLTFGRAAGYHPAEALWCGELIPATPPAIGRQCRPDTIFGALPVRYARATPSGTNAFTDIMSIPPSVARRAFQAATDGATSGFFYVRRFVSNVGNPDQFVVVTCRMSGGGARTPFALTDVKLKFEKLDNPVLFVKAGDKMPLVKAEITYTGTGRLKGRWEIVLPGEEPPAEKDLLTEATLPAEQRALQRRYTQLSRFNTFLPPSGKLTLDGPEPEKLPTHLNGQYRLLLRIEASDDKEGDSNLTAVTAGNGIVHSGAVAGFPLPVLNYFVGGDVGNQQIGTLALLAPNDMAVLPVDNAVEFRWSDAPQGAFHRLEIETTDGKFILSALFPSKTGIYHAPPWLKEKAGGAVLRWRIVALDKSGKPIDETRWRSLKFGNK